MQIFNIIIFIGFITYSYYKKYLLNKNKNKNKNINILQNGLLSYALMKVKKNDIDNLQMNYSNFDGTKLPMFSGYDIINSCMTYIQDKDDLKNGLFYSKHIETKIDAIDKYLVKQFDTDSKIIDFF